MFSGLPVHVSLPADGVAGASLLTDGSVRVYGDRFDAPSLPMPIAVTDGPGTVLSGGQTGSAYVPTQWTIGADGHLVDESPLDPEPGRGFSTISPDGNWLAGSLPPAVPGQSGDPVVWQRGSSSYTVVDLPPGMSGTALVVGVSNTGDVIYSAGNGKVSYYAWSPTTGILPVQSLYQIEGNTDPHAADFRLIAMSADGTKIVGVSGDGTTLPWRATEWTDGVAHELPNGGHQTSFAGSISDDGRIIGGYLADGDSMQAAVWVGGTLHVLTAPGGPANSVTWAVVDGVGGDSNAWAAVGWNWGLWIARSDGVEHPLSDYLPRNYGLSLTGDNQVRKLLAGNDAIYLVTFEDTGPGGTVEGPFSDVHIAGHLLVLPNSFNPDTTDHLDINGDHVVSPSDALIVINAINKDPSSSLFSRPELRQAVPKIDVNGDGELSPSDALQIIDFINGQPTPASTAPTAEGESTPDTTQLNLLALSLDSARGESTASKKK